MPLLCFRIRIEYEDESDESEDDKSNNSDKDALDELAN